MAVLLEESAPAVSRRSTRDLILDAAMDAVLAKGFGATSIEELIAAVGISKSGFFYHFRDKNELASALLLRYIDESQEVLDRVFAEADSQTDDPLEAFMLILDGFADVYADLPNGHPGCLVASICYHERLFSRDVLEMNERGISGWRDRMLERLERVAAHYPCRIEVDLKDLADMLHCIADGAIILTRVFKDPMALPRQVRIFRDFVALAYSGANMAPARA